MPSGDRQREAFVRLWNAVRTCQLNVYVHKRIAAKATTSENILDSISAALAALAGIGILAAFPQVPATTWAVLAFISAIIGQGRVLFRFSEKILHHRRLQYDYSGVLSRLISVVERTKKAGYLSQEMDTQLEVVLERYQFLIEHDETDYDELKILDLQERVNAAFPVDTLWMPDNGREDVTT
jgi:hypothetical protein